MANVKLGNKTFSGVSSVKLDTTDGGTVTYEDAPVLQEKTVTENGEVGPDEGYDGLRKVTVNVPTSGGEINTGTCTVIIHPASTTNHYIARETVGSDGSVTYALSKSYTGDAISLKTRCDSVLYCLLNIKTATATGGELLRVQSGQGVAFKTPSENGASVEITLGN